MVIQLIIINQNPLFEECAEFKRIFHITHFFVTIFFVVGANNRKNVYLCRRMNEANCTQLLEEHGIKPTANRIVVVRELAKSLRPVTLAELETRILTIDKSNIFRALALFREHHLVHIIEGGSEGVRYELCHSHDHEHDEDIHPHFYCEKCQQTYCLDYTEIPEVNLPKGFEKKSANFMIKGICGNCKK